MTFSRETCIEWTLPIAVVAAAGLLSTALGVAEDRRLPAAGVPSATADKATPTDLPNLLCFWDFQDGPDRFTAQGKHTYELTARNGPIAAVPGGIFAEKAIRIERGQWLCVAGKEAPGLNLHGQAHVTIVAWIQRECDAPWQYIAGVWNERDARRQYALFTCGLKQTNHRTMDRIDARHQTHGYVSDVGGATPGKAYCFSYATGGSKIEAGKWHMIGFTYDHESLLVYVDGELDVNGDCNPFPWNKPIFSAPLDEPADFTVAQRALPRWPGYPEVEKPTHEEGFCGLLGGLAVYDRALSGDEIRSLYRSTLEPKRRGD
jgi:hypothetical protein